VQTLGALLPQLALALVGDLLPVQPGFRLHPLPLLVSAAYGLSMALIFVLPPLGRARLQPVATLYREMVTGRQRPDRPASG
jgi:putative ABC transport system permease protein